MKRKHLLIIEINEGSCKILRAKLVSGCYDPTRWTALKIDDHSTTSLQKLLLSQVSSADKKAKCVVILNRQQVMLKNFSLPSQSAEELKKMISLQLSTHVPYAKEDIVFDYTVLGQDRSGYTQVLVAMIHKDVIEEMTKILKGAGLVPDQFILSSSSIASWARKHMQTDLALGQNAQALLSLDASASELCLIQNQQLVYARELKHGLRDIGGDFEEAFLKDISLTLTSFTREHPQVQITKFFVLSPALQGRLLDGLKEQGQRRMEVNFVDPRTFFKGQEDVIFSQGKPPDSASFLTCLGALEESQQGRMNLLPEHVRQEQHRRIQRRQLGLLALLFLLNLILVGGLVFQKSYQGEQVIESLKQQASQMRLRAEEVKRQGEQVKQIEQMAGLVVPIVEIFDSLYQMTPKEVSFQLLLLDRNNRLIVQGISETRSSVNDFQSGLIRHELFHDVNLEYAAQRKFFQGEITDFKITATVRRNLGRP